MGRKRAVLVGINYAGTEGELKGCLNDVSRMRRCLVDRFGFDEDDIRVLADADPSTPQPTGANIRAELERLVGDARPDQDFTELVQKVPDGCVFTMVSDSCHSGGLIDKAKEQIGNSTKQSKIQQRDREMRPSPGVTVTCSCDSLLRIALHHLPRRRGGVHNHRHIKSRSLPLSTFVEMLRARTGKDDVGVGSIRATLFHHFGDDASPKIRRLVNAMLLRHNHGAREDIHDKAKPEEDDSEGEAAPVAARMPRNGVLISGCQTDETSADATTPEGVSYGALSNAIQIVLAKGRRGGNAITNVELVRRARELLAKEGYTQQPGLYCSDKHANVAFICSNH
uniref:Peptidase C14 caspase domain-containing protein n=1 Tax=Leersia perrieri TaxID=77586 RepID=A0A0D9WI66_9ORYZ